MPVFFCKNIQAILKNQQHSYPIRLSFNICSDSFEKAAHFRNFFGGYQFNSHTQSSEFSDPA